MVLAHSKTGIAGSELTGGINVSTIFFLVLLYVGKKAFDGSTTRERYTNKCLKELHFLNKNTSELNRP
jgi:hypothetical protein